MKTILLIILILACIGGIRSWYKWGFQITKNKQYMNKVPNIETFIKNFKKPIEKLTKKELDKLFNWANNEIFEWESFRDKLIWEYRKRKIIK